MFSHEWGGLVFCDESQSKYLLVLVHQPSREIRHPLYLPSSIIDTRLAFLLGYPFAEYEECGLRPLDTSSSHDADRAYSCQNYRNLRLVIERQTNRFLALLEYLPLPKVKW